jgi:hypothetical protein
MKLKFWNLLVLVVSALTIIAFLFVFKENKIEPEIFGIPFIFWAGFLVTFLIVVATYIASKVFPFEDPKKP